jgi:DNA-binding GntR family transcriptional regulator
MIALPFIDAKRLRRLEKIDTAIGTALKSGDVNAYMQGNFDFHFSIYGAQPRRTLHQLIETLWLQFGPYMRVVYGRVGTANLVDQHEVAISAIRGGDVKLLGRAILADIRDGMGLIGQSGFDPAA